MQLRFLSARFCMKKGCGNFGLLCRQEFGLLMQLCDESIKARPICGRCKQTTVGPVAPHLDQPTKDHFRWCPGGNGLCISTACVVQLAPSCTIECDLFDCGPLSVAFFGLVDFHACNGYSDFSVAISMLSWLTFGDPAPKLCGWGNSRLFPV